MGARPRHRAPVRLGRHRRAGIPRAAGPDAVSGWWRFTWTSGGRRARSRASPTTRRAWSDARGAPDSRPRPSRSSARCRSFASVEEGLAAAVGLQDRWKSDGRWHRYLRYLEEGGRTLTRSHLIVKAEKAMSLASAALTETVKARALALGFDAVAIGPAEPPEHGPALERWIEAGHAGGMGYLGRRLGERLDPRRVLPGAASVVCRRAELLPGRARRSVVAPVARYAWGRDYHDVIAPRLDRLAAYLAEAAGAREPRLRRHGARARARSRRAGGARLDRQEHDAAPAGPRVVVLHRRAADHRGARARCAARRIAAAPAAPASTPARPGLRGALRARRPPLHLVPHDRASRRDRRRARVADGRVAVRLRPLPDRVPVEPQGAGDGRGGVRAVGTLSGGGRGARDDGRRAAPPLRRHAALAAQARRPSSQCGHRACQCPSPRSP